MSSRKKLKHLFISAVIFVLLLLWFYRNDADPWRTFTLILSQEKTNQSVYQFNQTVPPEHVTEPPAPQDQTAPVITVKNTKTLLISAYLEHRTDEKKVRVIAVVKRSEKVAYRCLLRCQEQIQISEGSSSIHRDHFGFKYGTADIMCRLPEGCKAPSHIAVTSAAAMFEDKANHDFLEIKNQKAETNSFPYNFTVCISTMYDFNNVLQFVQNVEMLQLLGVNRFVIYKTNCSPEMQRVLDYYTRKGLLEVIPWSLSKFLNVSRGWLPIHGPGELHYFGQIPALSDCLYRNMYQSKYVALHDIDELILPKSVSSWLELLPVLKKKFHNDKCYMFINNVFPNNIALPPPTRETPPPQGCWANVSGVNILEHLYREPDNATTRMNYKIIVNPRAVFTVTVHGVLDPKKACVWAPRNIARMYHTRPQRQPNLRRNQLIYENRLLSYSAPLIPAVNTALKESGLVPVDGTC